MIRTSENYEPFAQVRRVDCLISFEVLAKTLNKKNIAVTAPSARVGSGPLTINGIPELAAKYGTLERYGWPLDGSCDLLPSSGAETGYWSSAVSDDAGDFDDPVTFRYDLPSDTATFGWTFHVDAPAGVIASRVRAVCYDAGGDVIDTAEGYVEGTVDPPRPTVTVGIEPVQAGSGDPSPDNVRPITGWTGVNIHVSPTSDPADGRTYSVEFPSEAGTVYGGTLDVTSGVLTVDRVLYTGNTADMDNTENYPGWKNAGMKAIVGTGVNNHVYNVISNITPLITPGVRAFGINTNSTLTTGTLFLDKNYFGKNQTEWKSLAIDVQAVIPLSAPITYQLTPVEISRILDTDNVWADCGPVLDIGSVPGNRPQIVKSGSGWSFHHYVQNYRAVEFTFYGTNLPRRMLRLAEIDFGVSKHFDRDSIKNARIKYGMTPDASAFPAKEIVFTFDNSDGDFNVLNPIGVYQYWRNGQVLTARIKVGDEIVPMGLFYVTKAEIGENRLLAKVTAHDPCYQLANQKFYPMELAAAETVRLDQAVPRALIGSDLEVDYGGLGAEPVSVAVRDTHDKRVILRYLAQAVRAAVWIDRDNVLRFRRISTADEEDGSITADELYNWSGVSIAEEYTGVTLTVNRELQKDADGNDVTETYRSGVLDSEGTHTATYENPCVAAESGQAVADWLLVTANRRKKYAVKNRCDPAVEIGDTLVIADAFHNDDRAVVTGLDIEFDGGLVCVTEADREF